MTTIQQICAILLLTQILSCNAFPFFFWSTAIEIELCKDKCYCPEDVLEAREKGMDCRGRNLTKLDDALDIPDQFTKVDFSRNKISVISAMTFEESTRLEKLDFSSNELSSLPKGAFQYLTGLQNLVLKNNRIKSIDPGAFEGLLNLTKLDLSYNSINVLPADVFGQLGKMEELSLAFNPMQELDSSLLRQFSSLKSLDLSSIGVHTIHPEFFPRNLTNLQKLSLGYNFISIVPSKALYHLGDSLLELDLSGNPIKSLGDSTFYGLGNLKRLHLDQMLQLESIDAFAFGDLDHLETCVLRYMPRIKSIDPKAFHSTQSGADKIVRIDDFTLSFSILTILPEDLLDWDQLHYVSLEYNHWCCDCNIKWMKNSTLMELVGEDNLKCSQPDRLRGHRLARVPDSELCRGGGRSLTKYQSLGFLIGLMVTGIGVSMLTVSMLVYWRRGWLCHPPEQVYSSVSRDANSITVADELEWDNKDLQTAA